MGGYCGKLDALTMVFAERCRIRGGHEGACHPRNAKNPLPAGVDAASALKTIRDLRTANASLENELREANALLARKK